MLDAGHTRSEATSCLCGQQYEVYEAQSRRESSKASYDLRGHLLSSLVGLQYFRRVDHGRSALLGQPRQDPVLGKSSRFLSL